MNRGQARIFHEMYKTLNQDLTNFLMWPHLTTTASEMCLASLTPPLTQLEWIVRKTNKSRSAKENIFLKT